MDSQSDDFADPGFGGSGKSDSGACTSIGLFYCDGVIWENEIRPALKKFSCQKDQTFKTEKWKNSYFLEKLLN